MTTRQPAKYMSKVRPLLAEPHPEACRVLDAGCGTGRKSTQLARIGFSVTATAYETKRPQGLPEGVEFVGGVDLNGKWPWEDATFDYVYLSEVIEHLESLPATIREVRRVLKPGGGWLITCPNTATAYGRFYFLATGLLPGMKYPVPLTIPPVPGDNLYMPHLWQLWYFFHHYGFRIEGMFWDRVCMRSLCLAPLVYPCMLLGMAYAYTKVRDHDLLQGAITPDQLDAARRAQRESNRGLASTYLSPKMMLSQSLILVARKTAEGDRAMRPAPSRTILARSGR